MCICITPWPISTKITEDTSNPETKSNSWEILIKFPMTTVLHIIKLRAQNYPSCLVEPSPIVFSMVNYNTLFEIFIFCPKIQLWFHEKIVDFFGAKNSWKCCGFGLFSCWQLWFHEKNCRKKIWMKNSWKCWGFVKIVFLEKKLTFRIVCGASW